jgi:FkbM family methyltransferase
VSNPTGLALARYEARRVAQTQRTFANWPVLLRGLVGEKFGRGGDTLTFVTRSGVRLTCPNVPGARLPMYEQFADDCYDLGWVLGADTGQPLQILDVGSHVGAFATNAASARANVRVECYEPSPDTASFLKRNVEQNGLADRVRVHERAMSGTEGTALLDDNSGGSVHNGLIKQDHRLVDGDDGAGSRATVTVTTTTFDRAVQEAPAPFDVVKMDCEGGEYELVYASSPQSWTSVQRVVMEYHPVHGESWAQLSAWFENVGLHVVRHKSDSPGLGTAWLQRAAGRGDR